MLGFLFTIGQFIWDLFTTVAEVTIEFIWWTLQGIWLAVTKLINGLGSLGSLVFKGFQASWEFLKSLYEDVLKPAWDKFWQLFDRVRTWLNETFGPVIKFLLAVRDEIQCFYKTWIRPVLDVIDATRQVLKVLEALHIQWAIKLDNALGDIETWVNQKFEDLLRPLNGLINLVNRVITIDGLLQRVAMVRTLERDVAYLNRLTLNSKTRTLSDDEQYTITRAALTRSVPDINDDLGKYFAGDEADIAPLIQGAGDEWRSLLGLDDATTAPADQTA